MASLARFGTSFTSVPRVGSRVRPSSSKYAKGRPLSSLARIPLSSIRLGINCRDQLTDIPELAESIATVGLLEPLVVRPVEDGYRLVCGYRRHAACSQLGIESVPCHVREMTDREEILANLAENETRRPVNPIETGKTLKRMQDEFGFKQQEMADQLGKTQTWVSNHLRILDLPAHVQKRIAAFEVGVQTALRPFRQRRAVTLAGRADEESMTLVTLSLSKGAVRAGRAMARRQRQTFEEFVEENVILAVDWDALGLANPLEKAS